MPPFVNFGIEFGLSLLVFSLLAKWYVWPFLNTRPFNQAMLVLLVLFLPRYLGLMSLVPGVVDPAVTRSDFAFYQAYGDLLAFLLAFAAFILVRSQHSLALAMVWIFNIFGRSIFFTPCFAASWLEPGVPWEHFGMSRFAMCLWVWCCII